jgi:hypothetical protein
LALGLLPLASALAWLALVDLDGESAEAARRRCGDGEGLGRGAAGAAPAATMAAGSRGISGPGLAWGLGFQDGRRSSSSIRAASE